MTDEMTFEQVLDTVKEIMALIETIPLDVYPAVDDSITDAFNSLDDAYCNLSAVIADIGATPCATP